ncbi:MAG: SRPBCC family protein [Novosphingobium sp.]|uniref:SRPBCC family protein n=1 Tax=Novosphingobium sp. TaxID=1874826 RepID=UPI003C7B7A8C
MRKTWMIAAALAGILLPGAGPAGAEVTAQSDSSFIISLSAETAASKDAVWKMLVTPAKWWSPEHTWSGDAANLYIDSQATGCFCEKLPKPADAPIDQRMGSVEHMHIVFADPQRGLLRMKGGLGPLQGEPASGVWTIELKPSANGGTVIVWDYVVSGLMRTKGGEIAPAVDQVMSQQLGRLVASLGSEPI